MIAGIMIGVLVSSLFWIWLAIKDNRDWSNFCEHINAEWADFCEHINAEWADYCKNLINEKDKDGE